MTVRKEGRRISAATRAKLEEAIEHTEKFVKCIREILDGDDADDEKLRALQRSWETATDRLIN